MIKKTSSNQSCGSDKECKMVRFYSPSVYLNDSLNALGGVEYTKYELLAIICAVVENRLC